MLRSLRLAAAANEDFNQTPPPSYLVLMEEGLPSYEEAVMVGQEMKQGMVSDEEEGGYLPSYVEAAREEEETEGVASKERTDEALDEVFEEALEEVKLEEVGTEMAVLEGAFGAALDKVLQDE